ncbi:MAG: NUDIX domain-containing protein [Candidatus Sericytochromatia bacterium]
MHIPLDAKLLELGQARDQAWIQGDTAGAAVQEQFLTRWVHKHGLKTVSKVCACVWRSGENGPELLAFDHPTAGKQIVKGTLEPGEDLALAVLRELEEESGLKREKAGEYIGLLHHGGAGGIASGGAFEHQIWHLFAMPAQGDEAPNWSHIAEGSLDEAGLEFRFFWQPLQGPKVGFAPVFLRVMALLEHHLQNSPSGHPGHPGHPGHSVP